MIEKFLNQSILLFPVQCAQFSKWQHFKQKLFLKKGEWNTLLIRFHL